MIVMWCAKSKNNAKIRLELKAFHQESVGKGYMTTKVFLQLNA